MIVSCSCANVVTVGTALGNLEVPVYLLVDKTDEHFLRKTFSS